VDTEVDAVAAATVVVDARTVAAEEMVDMAAETGMAAVVVADMEVATATTRDHTAVVADIVAIKWLVPVTPLKCRDDAVNGFPSMGY